MLWLNLFWWLVIAIGNAEILITAVNRVHSLPIHEKYLKELRHLHDLLIPLFPSWVLVVIGFFSPGVFFNPVPPAAIWEGLPLAVQIYFSVCFAGFLGFLFSTLRNLLHRTPTQQTAFSASVVDVEEALGKPPVGDGPFDFMTKVPLNECFTVEFNEREFTLNRLPPEWDGLRILHLTDLHFIGNIDLPFYEFVFDEITKFEFDMVCFTGDLLDGNEFAEWSPSTIGRLNAPLGKFFILGNHDWYLDTTSIRDVMIAQGWRDMAGSLQVLDTMGPPLAIGGDERPWMGRPPNFHAGPGEAFRLLLSHTPDNFSWARRVGVDLMLTGHNHGGQVVLPVIGPVYSPSLHGVRFAGGLFYSSPTLLYVSRGLGGRHPLRINARPEISILTLKSAKKSSQTPS
jgi:predicted MPP superfamily phosphohydrolase